MVLYKPNSYFFKTRYVLAICLLLPAVLHSQWFYPKEQIFSAFAKQDEAAAKRRQQVVAHANSLATLPAGSSDEAAFALDVALWNVSQFRVKTPQSEAGVARLLQAFDSLGGATQRALLEVVYGQFANKFLPEVKSIAAQTTHPKTFAMAAVHLYRASTDADTRQWLTSQIRRLKPNEQQKAMLESLQRYIEPATLSNLPPLDSLFARQRVHGFKVVYSFQRASRNHAGLAVVQNPDGSFARDSLGRLLTFVQLARSASNLPYFITNGSTPQGLFSIRGTAISNNVFIGPTPNLQSAMPFEIPVPEFTHYFPIVLNATPERIYRSYFPDCWQQWPGLMEAFYAGKAGRGEIIAHGSTIDPEWFAGESFYPLSPTLGCLSGLELWNKTTGKIDRSDQLDLVNAFLSTPGKNGYLMVINLNDKNGPVTREEVEQIVTNYELGPGTGN